MSYIIKTNQVRQVPAFRKHLFDNVDKFLSRLNLSCPILEKMVKNRYTEVSEGVNLTALRNLYDKHTTLFS